MLVKTARIVIVRPCKLFGWLNKTRPKYNVNFVFDDFVFDTDTTRWNHGVMQLIAVVEQNGKVPRVFPE